MRRLVGAYLEGRPTELSSVDGWGWVKKLKCVFETQQEVRKTSIVERGRLSISSTSSQGDEDGGFDVERCTVLWVARQRVDMK